jgi:desulfoferrodoxin (superoxide reductase-like protein)
MASSLIPYPIEPADNPVTAVPDEDDEPHRAAVAQALRAWVDAKITPLGNVGPMQMVQHIRWITMVVEDLLTVDQLAEEQIQAVRRLREVIDEYRRRIWDWWVLVDTPELARSVVAHQPPEEFEHHLAHDWVHALLADYDRTRTGEKAKPRAEVTREAIYAATKQRLGHAD